MKRLVLLYALFITTMNCVLANDSIKAYVDSEIKLLRSQNAALASKVASLESSLNVASANLIEAKTLLAAQIDSVEEKVIVNSENIKQTADELGVELKSQNETLSSSITDLDKSVSNRTILLVCLSLVLLIALVVYIFMAKKKSSHTDNSIKLLKEAQRNLQEQSLKLDNQLIDVLEKKMKAVSVSTSDNVDLDHSLPLKVADEIVRIQNNIDRMDPSDKNVSRLNKALDRMKSSFTAYGYEIVDMRGQEYTDNMPFEARFIPDDEIEEGKRIISGMDRLMVRYNGKMIQAPILAVRQNI